MLGIIAVFFLVWGVLSGTQKNNEVESEEVVEQEVSPEASRTDEKEGEDSRQTMKNPIPAEQSKHLAFKGVPIDGTLKEYVYWMRKSGFSGKMRNREAILKGDFAGFKDCIIHVHTLQSADVVNTISVSFPERDDWSALEDDYRSLRSMLTKKYGKPSKSVERFQGYVQPYDNTSRLHDLQFDRCTYYTTYSTPKGNIKLSIDHDEYVCRLKLQYWDKINSKTVENSALKDL